MTTHHPLMTMAEVQESLERRIPELEAEAQEIADDHWRYHFRSNAMLPAREKFRLNVWVRRRQMSLEIFWTHFVFITRGASNKSAVRSKYIPKGSGHKYRTRSLTLRAKNLEIEKALEVEDKMAKIRSEYNDVKQALKALKRAQQKAAQRTAMDLA